jgi:hypothetical protein
MEFDSFLFILCYFSMIFMRRRTKMLTYAVMIISEAPNIISVSKTKQSKAKQKPIVL